MLRSLALALPATLWIAACGSAVHIEEDGPSERPSAACEGTLGPLALELEGELGRSLLLGVGDRLVGVSGESVVAFDPCTGTREEWFALDELGAVAQSDADVYATGTREGTRGVFRFDVGTRTLSLFSEIESFGRLAVSPEGRVVMMVERSEGTPDDPADFDLIEIVQARGAVPFGLVETWAPGTSTGLIGASRLGAYVLQSYDCGCNPTLVLHPFDGSEKKSVESSAGALHLAFDEGQLLLATDLDPVGFGESVMDIVRVPLEGGEPEVLVPREEGVTQDVYHVASDPRNVCFKPLTGAPRCLERSSGKLGQIPWEADPGTYSRPIALAQGAVGWLRMVDEDRYAVMVAAP